MENSDSDSDSDNSLYDPELVESFREECEQLLTELVEIVNKLEEFNPSLPFPVDLLESFAQKIDRIMGTSKTISMCCPDHVGFQNINKITELCKQLGYKARERQNSGLIPIFGAFWGDTLEVLQDFNDNLDSSEKCIEVASQFARILQGRLEWLFKKIVPHKVENADAKPENVQSMVDDLLKDFGL